jgi:hypothetical protein
LYRSCAPAPLDDPRDFADALGHWTPAAFQANPSPRELKRFLNRLRFVAAGPGKADLAFPTLVGLAVFAHADRTLSLVRAATNGVGLATLREQGEPVSEEMVDAASSDALARHHLGPFAPTPKEVERFLELWGITMRSPAEASPPSPTRGGRNLAIAGTGLSRASSG